jgi:hypothetical protein
MVPYPKIYYRPLCNAARLGTVFFKQNLQKPGHPEKIPQQVEKLFYFNIFNQNLQNSGAYGGTLKKYLNKSKHFCCGKARDILLS